MRRILPFDELNNLQTRLADHFTVEPQAASEMDITTPKRGQIKSKKDVYDIIDMLLDLFLLAYANGVEAVNEQFGTSIRPTTDEIEAAVYKRIDGATWVDRVWAWYDVGGTMEDIIRIAETEAHRDGNTAADITAKKAGATTKTWVTMLDDRVREQHQYLEATTVGIDDDFYTYDGDHAPAPGLFEKAENNVRCRCELEYR